MRATGSTAPAPGVCHDPIFDLATGTVVGTRVLGCAQAPVRRWRPVAHELATGVPARDGWRVSSPLAPAVQQCPELAEAVLGALRSAGFAVPRLIVEVGRWRPGAPVPPGLGHLIGAGASIEVDDDPQGLASALDRLPVAQVRCPVGPRADGAAQRVGAAVGRAGVIGAPVIVDGVASAAQLVAAVEGGASLGRGPWWGMPGSLQKAIVTWQRPPGSLSG